MGFIYDKLGVSYSSSRSSDPAIEAQIHRHLNAARRIVNIGAGTGSYEPVNIPVIAVEPATTMIRQRQPGKAPAVRAVANALPFPDGAFSTALSILSVHHWENRESAFAEIRRVVTDRALFVTWDPDSGGFWLTRDYFPELLDIDRPKFPTLAEFHQSFESVDVFSLMIPHACTDGFLGAYWRRPHYYLDEMVRAGMSTFAELDNPDQALRRLAADLESGRATRPLIDLNATSFPSGNGRTGTTKPGA